MEIVDLLTIEMALIGLIGTGVGWIIKSTNQRFDKIDERVQTGFRDMSGKIARLHDKVEDVKDNGSREHQKIGERLAGIESDISWLRKGEME